MALERIAVRLDAYETVLRLSIERIADIHQRTCSAILERQHRIGLIAQDGTIWEGIFDPSFEAFREQIRAEEGKAQVYALKFSGFPNYKIGLSTNLLNRLFHLESYSFTFGSDISIDYTKTRVFPKMDKSKAFKLESALKTAVACSKEFSAPLDKSKEWFCSSKIRHLFLAAEELGEGHPASLHEILQREEDMTGFNPVTAYKIIRRRRYVT